MRHRTNLLMAVLLVSLLSFTAVVNAYDCGCKKSRKVAIASNPCHYMTRMKVEGTVEKVEPWKTTVRTSEGSTVVVMTGPESYWAARGYRLSPGSDVVVYGYYPENRVDMFYAETISGSNFHYRLADSAGRPYWVESAEYTMNSRYPSYEVYEEWYGPTYYYTVPGDDRKDFRLHKGN